MLPDSRQAETLLAILDTGSFEQAAAQLHITASAVSQRIGALEAAQGAPLVIRSRPCRPTRAGQHLAQYLRRSKLLEQEFLAESGEDSARPCPCRWPSITTRWPTGCCRNWRHS